MQKELTFYLIRHGRTVWNDQGLMQGSGNSNLTEEGVKGAILTGKALAGVPFIAAYSSCLQRTIDTANHILGTRNIPLFQHNGLNEQGFGSWEGQDINLIRELNEFKTMLEDPANYKAETNGGETWEQVAERAMKAIHDIATIHNHGNILIVSHGHTIRLLMALFNGATWQNHRETGRSESMRNTSINIVRYIQNENDIKFVIEKINDVAHLS